MYFFKSEKRTTQNLIPNDFFLVEKLSIFWSQLWNTLKSKQKTFGKTGCFCNRNFDRNFENYFVATCYCQLEKLIFLSKRDFVRIRVTVQGVKSLGSHFACLWWGLDFYKVKKYYFSKRKGKYYYTFNHSSKRENQHKSTTKTPNLSE